MKKVMTRTLVIRLVALVWLGGTFYVSFLLFSTRTSIRGIAWNANARNSRTAGAVGKTNDDDDDIRPEPGTPGKLRQGPEDDRPGRLRILTTPTLPAAVEVRGSIIISDDNNSNNNNNIGSNNNNNSNNGWPNYSKYKRSDSARIWPIDDDDDDRILSQIDASPPVDTAKPPKLIYMRWGLGEMKAGRQHFLDHRCPVNWCSLTEDEALEPAADMVYYKENIDPVRVKRGLAGAAKRNRNQVSLFFNLESPQHSSDPNVKVNWTATYRTDAVINAPYEKFVFFKNFSGLPGRPARNFAAGKTKKVAWFVSNCWATNRRLAYAKQLAKYIQVDIYGSCGHLNCPRDNSNECWNMLKRDYKFYLSFENSNCRDYITEKFFVNALSNDVLPIVMGAHPDDYKKLAPPNSYIHVDQFESPKELAKYLHKLDKNDDLYNQYFLWKGSGELIDTKFWCRLCSLLHERERQDVSMWYDDLSDWIQGPGVCLFSKGNRVWYSWNDLTVETSGRSHLTIVERSNKQS